VTAIATGCSPRQAPAKADLHATDTAGRVPALVDASAQSDADTLAELVRSLNDEDPAVRMFAARSLQERTGQSLGYRYYDPQEKRSASIARWQAWLDEQAGPDATVQADAPDAPDAP